MITPQEIRERTFEKAVFGGYDMATVDAFMEEIASDLTLLQKENAVLRGKMKVLADKVDEYRGNEDALRMAMLTAQRVSASLEKEAREKYDAVIRDAKSEATRIIEEATYQSRTEKEKLDEAKAISAKFIDNMEMLCNRHMDFLRRMNELDFVKQLRADAADINAKQAAAAVDPLERQMTEAIRSSIAANAAKAAAAEEPQAEPDAQPGPEAEVKRTPTPEDEADPVIHPLQWAPPSAGRRILREEDDLLPEEDGLPVKN